MKTFNSAFNAERAKRGTAPMNLIEFGFTAPVRVSDRDVAVPQSEDYTEYPKTDPAGRFAVSMHEIIVTALAGADVCFLCQDFGAGYFGDDFTHYVHYKRTDSVGYGRCIIWGMGNDGTKRCNDQSDYLSVSVNEYFGGEKITIGEYCNVDVACLDHAVTGYWLKISRDDATGDYGTLTVTVYSDPGYSQVVDTMAVTLQARKDFRYLYGASSAKYTSSSDSWTGMISHLSVSGLKSYSGITKSWGYIDTGDPGAGLMPAVTIPDVQLQLINSTASRFSDNFASEPPESIEVTLYQYFAGLAYDEKETLFKGIISGHPEYDERVCMLRLRGIMDRYNRLIGDDLIISADDYASADPDDIGKMRNIGYGDLTRIPCRALKAGCIDTLRDDLDASAVSFFVSLGSKAAYPSGTVVVQIDDEQISGTYAPATGQFTSCTRGYNSTTAVAHDAGAKVAEVLTEYVYEIFSHPAKSIGDVRVGGVKVTSGYTAYTGQSGDELTGYEDTAVVKFTALPTLKPMRPNRSIRAVPEVPEPPQILSTGLRPPGATFRAARAAMPRFRVPVMAPCRSSMRMPGSRGLMGSTDGSLSVAAGHHRPCGSARRPITASAKRGGTGAIPLLLRRQQVRAEKYMRCIEKRWNIRQR
ncbi:MAG: hypothetical protein JRE40_15815 [Deltaproteobacteria bacterium]|nr:hypothetical protein [Deltaproteobacteria bacterium]